MNNRYRKLHGIKSRFRGTNRTPCRGWNISQSIYPHTSIPHSMEPDKMQEKEELEKLEEKKKFVEEKIRYIRTRIENLTPVRYNTPPVFETKTGFIAVIDRARCSECGVCTNFCPQNAIKIKDVPVIDRSLCTGCGTCIPLCPRNAISMKSVAEVQ